MGTWAYMVVEGSRYVCDFTADNVVTGAFRSGSSGLGFRI